METRTQFSGALRALVCGLAAFVMLASLGGCHRVTIQKDRSAGRAIEQREDFFAFGLIGSHDVDVTKLCPQGAASYGDSMSPLDALFTVGTLGIYAPRTVRVECAR